MPTAINVDRRTTPCQSRDSRTSLQPSVTLLRRPSKLITSVVVPRFVAGTSALSEMKNGFTSAVKVLVAMACRTSGALGRTIFSGAMDTATKSSPTRAAPALALAMKKLAKVAGTMTYLTFIPRLRGRAAEFSGRSQT